ncbi:MAG: aspartate carbamoyltransferase [Magnetococcales bacterium]|nr:aspartate carbamoyltransferase [Magnetococcales bacterium]
MLSLHEYESRIDRPVMMKIPEFNRENRLKHILFSSQMDKMMIDMLCRTALKIKHISSTKPGSDYLLSLLSHKRAMLYFTQVSTRTFMSFMAASQILGIKCNEIRDQNLSSEFKGESPLDSIRMFSSYFDVIIMRSKTPNFAEACAYLMNDLDQFNQRSVPIINAGAGADEHPTQALLDIFTLQRTFGFTSKKDSSKWNYYRELKKNHPDLTKGLNDKVYGFCGDLRRGRTVRSLVNLLSLYENISVAFISPDSEDFRFPEEEIKRLEHRGVTVYEYFSLDEAIDKVDMLYMTRIQKEYDKPDQSKNYDELIGEFILTPERAERLKTYCPILHPFPRNEEIPFEIDSNPRAMYFRQARNGMWVRAALIAHLFDVESQIANYYQDKFSEYHNYNMEAI